MFLAAYIALLLEMKSSNDHSKTRQHLIDLLTDRFRDVNAYTRTKVLHVWEDLVKLRHRIHQYFFFEFVVLLLY